MAHYWNECAQSCHSWFLPDAFQLISRRFSHDKCYLYLCLLVLNSETGFVFCKNPIILKEKGALLPKFHNWTTWFKGDLGVQDWFPIDVCNVWDQGNNLSYFNHRWDNPIGIPIIVALGWNQDLPQFLDISQHFFQLPKLYNDHPKTTSWMLNSNNIKSSIR